MINGEHNQTATIDNKNGSILIKGKVNEVNKTISELHFKPGCITNPKNSLELSMTFTNSKRYLEEEDTIEFGVPKKY